MEEDNIILADGLEKAFLGIGESFGSKRQACYSIPKIIETLMNMNMSYDEAYEFFEYNILGAYVTENMPIFIDPTPYSEFIQSYEETN